MHTLAKDWPPPPVDNWIHRLFRRLRAKHSLETLERHWPRILAAARKRHPAFANTKATDAEERP